MDELILVHASQDEPALPCRRRPSKADSCSWTWQPYGRSSSPRVRVRFSGDDRAHPKAERLAMKKCGEAWYYDVPTRHCAARKT